VLNVFSSIDITDSRERAIESPARALLVDGIISHNLSNAEISNLDWHLVSIDEVSQRLSTSLVHGLDSAQVARKRMESGKNQHSPPPSHLLRRLLYYVFGGFGSLLIVAGILCCVAWEPLGEPLPQVSNLALGVVLFVVAGLQAAFTAWQVVSNCIQLTVGLEYQSSHCFLQRSRSFGMEIGTPFLHLHLSQVISSKFGLATKSLQI
jgi:Cation transporter/ATPase, N-terminus